MGKRLEGVLGGGLVRTQPSDDHFAAARDHSSEHDGCEHASAAALQALASADESSAQHHGGNAEDDFRLAPVAEPACERIRVRRAVVLNPRIHATVDRADGADRPRGNHDVPPAHARWRGGAGAAGGAGGAGGGLLAQCRYGQREEPRDPESLWAQGVVARSTASTSIVIRTSSPTICAPSMKRFNEMP